MNNELHLDTRKVFLISLIGSLSLSALIAIFIFLLGSFGSTELKILATTLTIGGLSLTGLCSSILIDRKLYVTVGYFGIAASFAGFIFGILTIWGLIGYNHWHFKIFLVSMILAFSLAHSSLLLLAISANYTVNTLIYLTIFFISLVALMLIYLVLSDYNNVGELFFRILGVFSVLDVLGTITTPIIRKLRP